MPYRFNPFTNKLDYYKNSTYVAGASQLTPMSLVFCEEFTGDGSTTDFILNGSVVNAVFSTGSWSLLNTKDALPIDITSIDNKPLYDSSNIFTRNIINALGLSKTTGTVSLDNPPLMLEEFRIWYWYDLNITDVLSVYYREDYVASMESDLGTLIANNTYLNTVSFDGILTSSEDTVQKALDAIDDHEHGELITDTQIEDLTLTSFYVGYASNNAIASEPYWQIFKVIEINDIITLYYANGTENFDKRWDLRSTYTYN